MSDSNGLTTQLSPYDPTGLLLRCVKPVIHGTPAGITNLIPPVVFSDDVKVTKHTNLDQKLAYPIPSKEQWTCGVRPGEYKNDGNLWLNLSGGFIGGGRGNWDGTGGTGGGLQHYEDTGKTRPLAVKITTLSEGLEGVDCYSYDEDDMVAIPNLRSLLEGLGVDYMNMCKTAKTTSEMEVELNLNYDFSAITEEGSVMVGVRQEGVVGMKVSKTTRGGRKRASVRHRLMIAYDHDVQLRLFVFTPIHFTDRFSPPFSQHASSAESR